MLEDAELTRLARDGDDHAVEELYRRHHRAVLSYATRLSRDPQTAEDLANEAFARTLRTIRSGTGGPSGAWRPYLYTVVRNTASAWARSERRLVLTPEFADLPAEPGAEPNTTTEMVIRAYESLPERWKTVLWHTLIEEESPEQVADILGTTRDNVNVLAFRAREALRRAYLQIHFTAVTAPECHAFADRIARAVRKPSTRLPRALQKHLGSCPDCSRAYSDLIDLNATLRAAVPFAVLLPLAAKGGAFGVHSAPGATAKHAKIVAGKGLSAKGMGGIAAGGVAVAVVVGVAMWHGPGQEANVPRPAAAPPRQAATRPTPTPTPAEKMLSPAPIAGTRIKTTMLGACVGVNGQTAVTLPCGDRRTAWRRDGGGNFKLVNKVTGQCLNAAEHYDRVSFNSGIWAVRVAPCASAGTWSTPGFSDGVPRLVNDATGAALSIGETYSVPPPTAFILYGAYTGSDQQRFTIS
jgi:RNA polymerase sigma factor (sigma-70 family)